MGIITANQDIYNREEKLLHADCPSVGSAYLGIIFKIVIVIAS